jgi:nitrite reductase (NO-forming)
VPPVAMHVANGMYGMILVEPEDGLPPVDREFYVMQGEIYTTEAFGTGGLLTEDYAKLLDERPEFFVLNGHVGALTEHFPLKASVGETIRIFFGVGGPNFTSSFHVIGEIFDRVYVNGSVTSTPQTDVQTVVVPAGGAVITEMKLEVPGRYVLVDHSLSRVERGLAGWLDVEGEENPDIFSHSV